MPFSGELVPSNVDPVSTRLTGGVGVWGIHGPRAAHRGYHLLLVGSCELRVRSFTSPSTIPKHE